MDPLDFTDDPEELRKEARQWRDRYYKALSAKEKKQADTLWSRFEDGSGQRFEKIFKHRYFWWLVHNLIAHNLIGLFPVKMFFDFHDYTSRKMRS